MTLRLRAALLFAALTAAIAVGAGSASAAEPPTYGPEWNADAPGTGPEWAADAPGTGPEWQPGANPGTADILDRLAGGLFGR